VVAHQYRARQQAAISLTESNFFTASGSRADYVRSELKGFCLKSFLSPLVSASESRAQHFYDRWIGGNGLRSSIGRIIFGLSGSVYSKTFVRTTRLTSLDKVLDIGCGMGTVLAAAQKLTFSKASYLGIDLSVEMIRRGRAKRLADPATKSVELLVGSALYLPFRKSLFDAVLLAHVIKYLTDDQLDVVLRETARVLKPGGTLTVWEFSPFVNASITKFILKACSAHQLRNAVQVRESMEQAGYRQLRSFRVITPWLPWSNVAWTGETRPAHL
jgi:ubiquinone/menaquinone biosynthesis C-methylase UbiE